MTTREAAAMTAPWRSPIGWMAGGVYVMALATAAAAATHHASTPSPTTTTDQLRLATVVVEHHTTRPPVHRLRHRARHRVTAHRHAPTRPHIVRVMPRPTYDIQPVVSRSSDRITDPTPAAALVINVAMVATQATMQAEINDCAGPVAIVSGSLPIDIAEHDYCGGARFSALTTGEQVQINGAGLTGRYVVDGSRRFAAAGSSADQLDGIGDLALQTCVPDGVVLIGLDRVG